MTGLHAEAVTVFFVLSGYLVGGLSLRKVQSGVFSIRDFAADRASRIYTAYLPALLLTAALDHLGSRYFGTSGLYDHAQLMIREKISTPPFSDHISLVDFSCNMVMLKTFNCVPFGSNQPLWTISVEFWVYIFLAALLLVFAQKIGSLRHAAWLCCH